MSVHFPAGYTLPSGAHPLNHARILFKRQPDFVSADYGWLHGGNVNADLPADGFYRDAPNNSFTYEFWKPVAPLRDWEYDNLSNARCDTCCIAAHNFAATNTVIRIQYYDAGTWVTIVPNFTPLNDGPIFIIFPETIARQWRVRIMSYDIAPHVGVIRFGLSLQIPRPIFGGHNPIDLARQVAHREQYSENNHFIGMTVDEVVNSTSYRWSNIPDTWVHEHWRIAQKQITADAVFMAWRPSDYTEYGTAYGVVTSVVNPANSGTRNLMDFGFTMRGIEND